MRSETRKKANLEAIAKKVDVLPAVPMLSEKPKEEVAKILIKHGADVNAAGKILHCEFFF